MSEVPQPVKTITAPLRLHCLDHLVVPLRAAGLDDRPHARVERQLRPVGEWEERVRRQRCALAGVAAELAGSLDGEARRRQRGSSGPRPPRASVSSRARTMAFEDTCLQMRQAKSGSARVVLRRLAARDLHRLARIDVRVRVLDGRAARRAPVVALARRHMAALRVEQHTHCRLRREGRACVVVEAGGKERLDEALGQSAAERASRSRDCTR